MSSEKLSQGLWQRSGLLLLSIALLGCHLPLKPEARSDSRSIQVSTAAQQGQVLPVTARTEIGGQMIDLEVARTPQEQATGLMYRRDLAANRGMLFLFEPPQPVSFWMKNTLINLDMIFLHQGQVVAIAQNVPPCTTTPCPVYGPKQPVAVDQVIELPGGRVQTLGLKVGDPVKILSVTP